MEAHLKLKLNLNYTSNRDSYFSSYLIVHLKFISFIHIIFLVYSSLTEELLLQNSSDFIEISELV